MEIGLVRSVDIDREMQQAYLDYAMSVIVARALPDARDGLKPVHRRILYAMYDMGMRPEASYKKSARIVGEVLGKYHPHGDMAVYEAMARMAQDFSMRYMLVDGQGNFGSVDGDPPAAMRYTEARLAATAMDMLADIQKNTVNFTDNFDGSLVEPDVLPSALPNMLVNGATGIAVGMSTSIPPHNLGEVVDALTYMLEKWDNLDDLTVEDLMKFIQGPDFPTGGLIIQGSADEEGLNSAYGSGRGRVTVQARAHFEEMARGRNRIIVTELPYMTNKSTLIERIAELVREGRLEGVADLRDESDRQGLRIVIELNKTADPEEVIQALYKNTPMRSTFSIIMLALVEGEPRMLGLKQSLRVYLDHRLVVIKRRAQFELEKAKARAHILEGLRIALKHLDEVIDLIRKSPDAETARTRLMKRFKLSEIQATSILDMPLRRLAALERKKIDEEYKELQAQIKDLEGLLRSPKRMRQQVADELQSVKAAYADRRRTHIIKLDGKSGQKVSLLSMDLTPEHTVWISVTPAGLIARTLEDTRPEVGGREAPAWVIRANTRDTLYLVNAKGDTASLPVHAVPEAASPSAGVPFHKVSPLIQDDTLAAIFSLPPKEERPEGWFLLTATRQGLVKKSPLNELPGATAKPFPVVKVNEGDQLGWVRFTTGQSDIVLASADGMAIRFSEDEIRPMGLVAAGVGGIKLSERDELVGLEVLAGSGELLLVASDGKAKRVDLEQFPRQGRYGQGVLAWKLARTVSLAGIVTGKPSSRITLHLEKLAPKPLRLDEAPLQTRQAAGKAIIDVKATDRVMSLTPAWEMPWLKKKDENGSKANGQAPRRSRVKAAPALGGGDGRATKTAASPKSAVKAGGKSPKTAEPAGKARAGAKKAVQTAAAGKVVKAAGAKPPVKKDTKPAVLPPAKTGQLPLDLEAPLRKAAKPAAKAGKAPAKTEPVKKTTAKAGAAQAKAGAVKKEAAVKPAARSKKPAGAPAQAETKPGKKPPAKPEKSPAKPSSAGKKPAASKKPAAERSPAEPKPAQKKPAAKNAPDKKPASTKTPRKQE